MVETQHQEFQLGHDMEQQGSPRVQQSTSEVVGDLNEVAEIKRYEDVETVDWVEDAVRENKRKCERILKNSKEVAILDETDTSTTVMLDVLRNRQYRLRYQIGKMYRAAQSWITLVLIGITIGIIAGILNIVTEWLNDFKSGYCSTSLYLNKNFCCWGESEDDCTNWVPWSHYSILQYFMFIITSIFYAFTAAVLVYNYAPLAAGSGISEIKCIIAGFTLKDFLGPWTLLIKAIGLPFAISSGLSIGKEGPSVHYASCVGNVIGRFSPHYRRNAAKRSEILSASAGTGVAVAFGSPMGGVLFALEEMSSVFTLKTIWRTYFCALVATGVLSMVNPFRTGQLVVFEVSYKHDWHLFEIPFFVVIGIWGGIYGIIVSRYNLKVQSFRKAYLKNYAVQEAVLLASITALICYFNQFLKVDMTEGMEFLFHECENGFEQSSICNIKHYGILVTSLVFATILRMILIIISYGCKVPAGIFVPSMATGATFGRLVGIVVQEMYKKSVNNGSGTGYFASCSPDVPCITPGAYAFLGAAASLSGITHLTVTVVVIMFELTGALKYIIPTMVVVGVTTMIISRFGNGGIADQMIFFNGLPLIDNKEEPRFDAAISKAMTRDVIALPLKGLRYSQLTSILKKYHELQGFPLILSKKNPYLLGYIGRVELTYGIEKQSSKGEISLDALCHFASSRLYDDLYSIDDSGEQSENRSRLISGLSIESNAALLSRESILSDVISEHVGDELEQPIEFIKFDNLVNLSPITAQPQLPLETAHDIFLKLGPRIILVQDQGMLCGLLTRKDILKYHFRHDKGYDADSSQIPPPPFSGLQELENKMWSFVKSKTLELLGQTN